MHMSISGEITCLSNRFRRVRSPSCAHRRPFRINSMSVRLFVRKGRNNLFYTIYKLTNLVNGKYYIGMHQTSNLNDSYITSGKLIKAAIKKYGIENFKREILHVFDNEHDMKLKEKELVVVNESTYNLCDGGNGGFGYINRSGLNNVNHDTEAMKAARSTNMNALWSSAEFRSRHTERTSINHKAGKMDKGYFGNRGNTDDQIREKANSPSSLEKRIKTYETIKHQQGEKNSQYGTCWVTDGHISKKIKKCELERYRLLGYKPGRIKQKCN